LCPEEIREETVLAPPRSAFCLLLLGTLQIEVLLSHLSARRNPMSIRVSASSSFRLRFHVRRCDLLYAPSREANGQFHAQTKPNLSVTQSLVTPIRDK
jgi:hypothetical protein